MTRTGLPLWELVGIGKSFPGVRANDGISLRLWPGEIHGLLGENGCGKSTLIKILSGVHQPDAGEIRLRGRPVRLADPVAARASGIATVFQEFSLVPTLTVAENIFLGRLPTTRTGAVDWAAMREGAVRTLRAIEVDLPPEAVVGELSVAQQQLVEIAKAITADAQLIILDEPTTALGLEEIAHLHALLRRMKQQQRAILYVSHRLDEVVGIVDAVTILKDGRVVSAAEESRIDIDYIVSAMIGRTVEEHYPKEAHAAATPVLEVRGIATANRVRDVSFTLRQGEVFGLGGVLGSGRTEIARALFGVDPLTRGSIAVDGRPRHLASPEDAIRAGIAYVPENRKYDGLFFNFAGPENITIANLRGLLRGPFLSPARERDAARAQIRDLRISAAAETSPVGNLSGGNQQKVIIARWLFSGARIFILDEPTQGIDIGAKVAVYGLINRITAGGGSVILISSDHDELIAMSDRIGIVRDGSIVRILEAGAVGHADLVRASAEAA